MPLEQSPCHLRRWQRLLSLDRYGPLSAGWHYADGVSHFGVRVFLLVLNLPTYLLLTMDSLKARKYTGFSNDIQPNCAPFKRLI